MLNRKRNAAPARFYSVRELASLADMSKRRMEKLLASNDVQYHHSGNRRLVFASSLERALPEFADRIHLKGEDD